MGVKIKPLKWNDIRYKDSEDEYGPFSESSASGVVTYFIEQDVEGGQWNARTPPTDERFGAEYGKFDTPQEAMAACQSDHEKTVMEFLE